MSQVPETIDRYQILSTLGQGGMGVVYRGYDPELKREVAIKVLLPCANPKQRRRFRLEIESLMRLRHPNLVSVHAAGEYGAKPYLIMELVQGEVLEECLAQRGPMEPRAAAELVRTLAQAVGHAHEAGILHRDLKPANVLIRPDGSPVLVDFGLARELDAERLTRTGAILGSPGFWAPEQACGRSDTGPELDVYGLGATLYACLTNQPPLDISSFAAALVAVVHQKPTAPSRVGRGDRALDAICLRCLKKEPSDRYASTTELAEALGAYLDAPPTRRVPLGAALAGLVATVALGGVGLTQWRSEHDGTATFSPAPSTSPAQSPDGSGSSAGMRLGAWRLKLPSDPPRSREPRFVAEDLRELVRSDGLPDSVRELRAWSKLCWAPPGESLRIARSALRTKSPRRGVAWLLRALHEDPTPEILTEFCANTRPQGKPSFWDPRAAEELLAWLVSRGHAPACVELSALFEAIGAQEASAAAAVVGASWGDLAARARVQLLKRGAAELPNDLLSAWQLLSEFVNARASLPPNQPIGPTLSSGQPNAWRLWRAALGDLATRDRRFGDVLFEAGLVFGEPSVHELGERTGLDPVLTEARILLSATDLSRVRRLGRALGEKLDHPHWNLGSLLMHLACFDRGTIQDFSYLGSRYLGVGDREAGEACRLLGPMRAGSERAIVDFISEDTGGDVAGAWKLLIARRAEHARAMGWEGATTADRLPETLAAYRLLPEFGEGKGEAPGGKVDTSGEKWRGYRELTRRNAAYRLLTREAIGLDPKGRLSGRAAHERAQEAFRNRDERLGQAYLTISADLGDPRALRELAGRVHEGTAGIPDPFLARQVAWWGLRTRQRWAIYEVATRAQVAGRQNVWTAAMILGSTLGMKRAIGRVTALRAEGKRTPTPAQAWATLREAEAADLAGALAPHTKRALPSPWRGPQLQRRVRAAALGLVSRSAPLHRLFAEASSSVTRDSVRALLQGDDPNSALGPALRLATKGEIEGLLSFGRAAGGSQRFRTWALAALHLAHDLDPNAPARRTIARVYRDLGALGYTLAYLRLDPEDALSVAALQDALRRSPGLNAPETRQAALEQVWEIQEQALLRAGFPSLADGSYNHPLRRK